MTLEVKISVLTAGQKIGNVSGDLEINSSANLLLNPTNNIQLNATTIVNGVSSAGSLTYNTGTISISGTTVTGSGTAFTTEMVGGILYWDTNKSAMVMFYNSPTSLTIDDSFSQASIAYTLKYDGFGISKSGNVQAQNLFIGDPTIEATITPQSIDMGGTYSSAAGQNPKLKIYDDNTNFYGIGASLGQMDYMTTPSATHAFYIGGSLKASLNSSGNLIVSNIVTVPTIATSSGNLTLQPSSGLVISPGNTFIDVGNSVIRFGSNISLAQSNNTNQLTAYDPTTPDHAIFWVDGTLYTNTISTFGGDLKLTPFGNIDCNSKSTINAVINSTTNTVAANRIYNGSTWNFAFSGSTPTSGQVLAFDGTNVIFATNANLTWSVQTGTTIAMTVNNGYLANNAGLGTYTLPATSAVGDLLELAAMSAGGWKLAQNAGQNVRYGSSVTTTGTGGSLQFTAQGDAIKLVCTVANTSWMQIGPIGNITIV